MTTSYFLPRSFKQANFD